VLNKFDQELIEQLQQDGRLSYIALAKLLHISERTVRNRLKNLLESGIINITAMPNLDKLGYGFIGIVGLQVHLADLKKIGRELAKHPNVCYLANVTGAYEFIAIIVARSTREFAAFMEEHVSSIPNVTKTETFVTLNIYKGKPGILDTSQLVSTVPVDSSKRIKGGDKI
jgi:Lrp/AsnC family transcriptional regulator for asnA, asnC and gidA